MTNFFEIYDNYALNDITDITENLNGLRQSNPAQFGRKMIPYMLNAIGIFSRPETIIDILEDRVDAEYAEMQIILSENNLLNLNTDKIGYDRVNATKLLGIDEDTQLPIIVDVDITYEKETGIITFNNPMSIGDDIDIDFYKDGYFNTTLNTTEKRILGLCIQICWENKFINKEEDIMLIIEDKQTKIANQANRNNSLTNRFETLYGILQDEMTRYEDNCAIYSFPHNGRIMTRR